MTEVVISQELLNVAPHYRGAFIESSVRNVPTAPELWEEIGSLCHTLLENYTTETLKLRPGVEATRAAYRAAGKDPSRYRPACEQLCRRVLQGKGLYSIDTLVDIGNAVSIRSGYTVAVLDSDKIVGPLLTLGIGRQDEPYEAIGRGPLNIEHLPIFRDADGGIATPTSDHVRTQCGAATSRVLVIINGYDGNEETLREAANYARTLLKRYADATDISCHII